VQVCVALPTHRGSNQIGFGTSTKTWRTPNSAREEAAEAAHAEGLGRVVAGCDEVHPGLLRAGHRALDRLAGDERVEARGDRVLEVVGARAGHDPGRCAPAPARR
jgi:hypothetical protein